MTVTLHKAAIKYLIKLNPADRKRFQAAFDNLEKEPPEGDIRPYEGNPGASRIRVGTYRAIFKIVNNEIFVTHIEPRGEAYAKKTRSKRG